MRVLEDGTRSYDDEIGTPLRREVAVELAAVSAGRFTVLEGRAVPYDIWADVGWYLEQHAAGSLARSTSAGSGKGLPLMLFHDNRRFPIGVSTGWKEGRDGLHGTWRLNESADAQTAATMAQSGELGYMSIGFSPIRSTLEPAKDWNPDLGPEHMDRITRQESRLLEVSLTPTPAFVEAEVTLVRHTARRMVAEAEYRAWRQVYDELKR